MRGENEYNVPGFYNSIVERGLKSWGFAVSRFQYEGRVLRAGSAMCDRRNISTDI